VGNLIWYDNVHNILCSKSLTGVNQTGNLLERNENNKKVQSLWRQFDAARVSITILNILLKRKQSTTGKFTITSEVVNSSNFVLVMCVCFHLSVNILPDIFYYWFTDKWYFVCLLFYNSFCSWICMSCLASWSNQKTFKRHRAGTKTLFKITVPFQLSLPSLRGRLNE